MTYRNRGRYAIYTEADKYFVVWHHPDCGANRCGTFGTIEAARKSLASLKLVADGKRKHLEAIDEYA